MFAATLTAPVAGSSVTFPLLSLVPLVMVTSAKVGAVAVPLYVSFESTFATAVPPVTEFAEPASSLANIAPEATVTFTVAVEVLLASSLSVMV
ncbi:hypothetical protein D3C86_1972630 [compost metagenome]